MKLRAPHYIGIALLVIGLVAALTVQLTGFGRGSQSPLRGSTVVTGVVGSEKVAFFEDPLVQDVFAEHGYDVRVQKSGSWRMASLDNLTEFDFAFPASEIAAENISATHQGAVKSSHKPFFSPIAIATFEPILNLLQQNGVAEKDAQGRWRINMAAYLKLVQDDTRWNQLKGAASVYNSPRNVLLTSTDIRTSNSAGQYLALSAYVLNGDSVVTSQQQAGANLDLLTKLFVAQGYAGSSSTAPFENYLSQGMGAVPMVVSYEGQFLEEELRPNSRIQQGMVLAYPNPTIFSVHTGTAFTENGQAVMQLLETDPKLAELLAAHGFRPQGQNAAVFDNFVNDHNLSFPTASEFVNLAQEPSYQVLDYLLTQIGDAYNISGAPPATTDPAPDPNNTTPTNEGGTQP